MSVRLNTVHCNNYILITVKVQRLASVILSISRGFRHGRLVPGIVRIVPNLKGSSG